MALRDSFFIFLVFSSSFGYFRANPIKNNISVEAITAKYSSKISLGFARVKAITITAIQINRIVTKIEA